MNTEALASAIVGHLVGDYLLQNDWMALGKKENCYVCMLHALLWTLCVCLFAGWPLQGAWIAPILFVTHFIQDHTNIVSWWMRLKWKDQSRFMQNDQLERHFTNVNNQLVYALHPGLGPWSIIVVDNVWHIVTIWCVWRFLA